MKNIIYIKDNLHGEKDSRKGKQINKCRKKIIGLKIKIKKKGKLYRTAKSQCRGRDLQ